MEQAKELAEKDARIFRWLSLNDRPGSRRLKRSWSSDNGGLYFTLILRPLTPPALISRVSFAASLNLVKTLREDYDIDAKVKWPNDILVNEKKLSGMLAEMEMESDMVSF